MKNCQAHILIVDDNNLNLKTISKYLQDYKISTAHNGAIAWKMLENNPEAFDVILLDRMMPHENGMEVFYKIKHHPVLQYCPIILQGEKTSLTDINEDLNEGAYCFLTKPLEKEVLLSIIKIAVTDYFHFKDIQYQLEQTRLSMGMLSSALFEFKTIEQARSIASLVSNTCPNPEKIVMGLTELLINAIEHGNLGVGYDEKSKLNEKGTWLEEINNRLRQAHHIDKSASLKFLRKSDLIEMIITDQGNGFDHTCYMDFDPKRMMDNHGRGIAMANKLSFSAVKYNEIGNEVCVQIIL